MANVTQLPRAPQRDPGRHKRLRWWERGPRVHQAPRLDHHRPWRSGTDLSAESSEDAPKSTSSQTQVQTKRVCREERQLD